MQAMKLPYGYYYGEGPDGRRVCRGAMTGRRDTVPENASAIGKLRLVRLRLTDGGCYDSGGAYWGQGHDGSAMYWAKGDLEGEEFTTELFVRAKSRAAAKSEILGRFPFVTFYR
jgi:hypothetical protein